MEIKLGAGAKAVMMLAGITAVVWGLHEARPFIVPLITAGFITVVSLPVVEFLSSRGFPRWSAILLAVLLDLGVLFGFGGLVGGSLNEFYELVPVYQTRLAQLGAGAAVWVEHQGFDIDPDTVSRAVARVGVMDLVADLFQRVWAFGQNALLVALVVLFMLFEAGSWRIKLAYVLHTPTLDLPRFANAAREIQTYLVVKSGMSVVTGALCGVWVAVCGIDFPLLWALLAFFLNYIPTLGMFIATIPPVVVALIQFGPGSAVLVLGGYLVINFTLGNFVEPRVMGKALGLSPLVVFLSMVVWGLLWGPIGALLAVPLTMVIKILLASTEDLRWAAVLLGSREWLEQKRREWEDPFEAEKRRSLPPDYLDDPEVEAAAARASVPPPAPAEAERNPPLHAEDEEHEQYSGLRPRPEVEAKPPDESQSETG
ncbi:MAG: AI-2E family transporter [Myxococcales bacterium]|nr:AI-2E family transporter [Myxococcales bacterium]